MHVDNGLKSGHVLHAHSDLVLHLLGNDRDAVAVADHDEDVNDGLSVLRGDLHTRRRGRALDAEELGNVRAGHGRKPCNAFDLRNSGVDHHLDNVLRNADISFFRLAGDIVFRHSC